jgi:hypothetical protein
MRFGGFGRRHGRLNATLVLRRCCRVRGLLQALQGDREFVEGAVQTLLNRCLKGASYGDRCAGGPQLLSQALYLSTSLPVQWGTKSLSVPQLLSWAQYLCTSAAQPGTVSLWGSVPLSVPQLFSWAQCLPCVSVYFFAAARKLSLRSSRALRH